MGAEVVNPMPANVQGATVCKKGWCMAPKVVCWCMPKPLKVRDSAYVLLRVENL